MSFSHPQLLLLLLLAPVIWRVVRVKGETFLSTLRICIVLFATLYFAGPKIDAREPGMDVLVVADRSASVGDRARKEQEEIIALLGESSERSRDDRLGVVAFADEASLAGELETGPVSPRFESGGDRGSALAAALRLTASRVSVRRDTRVLVLSDGLYTGKSPVAATSLSSLSGVEVWYRHMGEVRDGDVSAGAISLPAEVPEGAGFPVRFSISGPIGARATYQLKRGGVLLAEGEEILADGTRHLFVRDVADTPGALEYQLEVASPHDPWLENNRSTALLEVAAAPRVLLATSIPGEGLIGQFLRGAMIPVDTATPEETNWSPSMLAPYSVVILENVSLEKLGPDNTQALAEAVEAGVVSLMVTGGEATLGQGGFHKSPLDPLLPVTMELREEQRRGRMAIATVLDRSGSMSMEVATGVTKMQLANTAVAEAIRLLSPLDQVVVIAVDSAAHTMVPLSAADDTETLTRSVLLIESMGGGIFVKTGLDAAVKELDKSDLPTRHILLFADAADAEEQEGCIEMARRLKSKDVGISVVGLGTRSDPDGAFLVNLAKSGGGKAYFTDRATELPRLFSQEVIRVSRRGFISATTKVTPLPDITRLQMPEVSAFPTLDGFNLSSPRPGASVAALTDDEYKSPIISFWQKGRANTFVLAAEVDGPKSGEMATWDRTPTMIVNAVRMLAAGVTHANGKAYATTERGNTSLRIELSPALAATLASSELEARFLSPAGGTSLRVPLTWDSPGVATATAELPGPGHYLPIVDLGEAGVLRAPPVTLPYSPEFLPSPVGDGKRVLETLAESTGGQHLAVIDDIYKDRESSERDAKRDISNWIALLVLILLLLEIAERRIGLSGLLRR